MKKAPRLLLLILLAIALVTASFGCGGYAKAEIQYSSDTLIVFKVTSTDGNATVLDVLNLLKEEGKLDFTSESSTYGAFLTSVNDKANTSSATEGYSWMIYTNDAESSSTDYGMVSYAGQTFGQTAYGISTQVVKADCLYALSYDHWSI